MKSRQHNDQKKKHEKTNNDRQNITQKTEIGATQAPLIQGRTHVLWKGEEFLLY